MSKYLTFTDVIFKDRRLLLAALTELGYDEVEAGESLPLYGYRGDQRSERAELVIRRRYVGSLSNDIGFARSPEGYSLILSEYDQQTLHGGSFLAKLRTAYSERVVEEVKRRLHGTIQRQVEGSVIKVRMRF